MAMATPSGDFLYGTHFYHPGGPPRSQLRELLKDIAQKHHFNVIRIYPPWDYYNPEPDRFVFDDLEEVLKYCDEFGLRVLMTILLEGAPYWLAQAHPETHYVDSWGVVRRLEGSGSSYTGGWPGLCMDWEPVQQAATRFIRELARITSAHRSLYAYDIWNEPEHVREQEPEWGWEWVTLPHQLHCYCSKTVEEFQKWLERRYHSLDALGRAWNRRYSDWKQVEPPRRPLQTYQDLVDWRRFIIDRTTLYHRLRVEAVRSVDPSHVIETHVANFPPVTPTAIRGVNAWRMAEEIQIFGLSFYPRWGDFRVDEGAARIEITRSNAAGKDFWVTELQGGRANQGLQPNLPMRPRDIRLWNWLAVAAGAKGIIYWAYLAEGSGREATGFGLVTRSGTSTDRVVEAAKDNQLIQSHWDVLRSYRPQVDVAFLYDQDDALLSFAMDGKEEASTKSFAGYYRAFWQLNHWVDFIEPAAIDEAKYKILVVPWGLIGKRNTADRLKQFVTAGGTLIASSPFGAYDESLYCNPLVPPHGLDEAFGYREEETLLLFSPEDLSVDKSRDIDPADRVLYGPEIEFSMPVPLRLKARTFLTPLRLSTAEAIAEWRGMSVAAMKQVGQGRVYYFGTDIGGSISSGDTAGIELLRAIVKPILQPRTTSKTLRPRLIEGEKRSLLLVFNDTVEDQTDAVSLPARYGAATDIYSRREYRLEGSTVQVMVPFHDVVVLSLVHEAG